MSRLFQRRPLAGLAALVGLGLLAAGCGGGGGSGAPAGLEKTNLTVVAAPAMDSAGLYIAEDRGLFAAEGLHVTILPMKNQAATLNSQLQGQLDVTAGNYVSYIADNSANSKADFRVLAPGSILQTGNQEILVPSNSKITTIAQLSHKTIGVNVTNNLGTLLVKSVLSDNAVPAGSVRFVPVSFSNMSNALADGKVNAAWLPEPFVTQDEEKIGAQPLADTSQGSSQNLPVSGYVVTASWLKKYPNTAAAFRTAILKAQAIAATDPGAVEQGLEKFAGTAQRTAAIANPPQYPTQQSAVLLQRLANLMLNFGMLQQNYNASQMVVK